MKQNKKTFSELCANLEKPNSQNLMKKARAANRLAKSLSGRNRQNAYFVKSRALTTLVKKLPARVELHKDILLPDFIVVELKHTNRGLHLPLGVF